VQKVIVRIPASTSNLGPGYDCLGVALKLYNFITVARAQDRQSHLDMVDEAARLFFKLARVRSFHFSAKMRENIPRCRGLGSSATVRVGILHALNELSARPLDRLSIFQLAAELERHPDNAAPASFGGFTVTRGESVQRFDVSSRLHFVLLVPDYEVSTPAARKVLPKNISRLAAVENSARACAITAAFASGDYEQLCGAFADQIHQPFRAKLNPLLPRFLAAVEKTASLGAFLSGSGSTICALTLQDRQVSRSGGLRDRRLKQSAVENRRSLDAIAAALPHVAKNARVIVTTADNHGVKIHGT
jgi:homoserine kinase